MTRSVKGLPALLALATLFAIACTTQGEHVIAERESPYHRIFIVEDGNGMRRLRFDRHGVDQSAVRPGDPDHIEFPYVRHLTNAFALRPDPTRVLFIGLGGGTFPTFARRHLPTTPFDIVELDPVVVECAERFMGFRRDAHTHVHVGDGRAFVERSEATWDVIILDAYGIDNIPYALATRPFLEAVRARLAPGGVIAANLWGEAVSPIFPGMLATYEAVFPEVHVLAPRGSDSRVILAFGTPESLASTRLVDAARTLRRAWGLRFDLPMAVREGYLPKDRWPSGGRVLEDRP